MDFYCFYMFLLTIIFAEGLKNTQREGKGDKCDENIDLAIVLDASASIGEENFNLAKDFAKTLSRRFSISRDKVRVSVVKYSQYINIMPKFSDDYDDKSIEHTLDKLFYEASSTGTGKTLEAVNFEVFSAKAGARTRRPDVRKVNIIVTDGYSGIGTEVVNEKANLLKNRGIEMFAIGVTNRMKEEELKILSSEPVKHHLFRLTNSKAVKEIVDSIVKQVCK